MGFSSLGVMASSLLLRLTSRKLSKMDDGTSRRRRTRRHGAKLALAGSDERDERRVGSGRGAPRKRTVDCMHYTRRADGEAGVALPFPFRRPVDDILERPGVVHLAEGYRVQGPRAPSSPRWTRTARSCPWR